VISSIAFTVHDTPGVQSMSGVRYSLRHHISKEKRIQRPFEVRGQSVPGRFRMLSFRVSFPPHAAAKRDALDEPVASESG